MRDATVSHIFFSLRGTLPRYHWTMAMLAALSVFTSGLSLLGRSDDASVMFPEELGISWPILCWCLAFVSIVTLICAKRLLDCQRPVWLVLTIPPSGVLLSVWFAAGMPASWTLTIVLGGYLALFTLPAFLACALCEAND